jgi:predicted nucleotidyltransferase
MELSVSEKQIIEEFKRRVEQGFPGEVVRLVLFGSKVRGDATRESDIDILVVMRTENWRLGDEIRGLGYALELEHGVVLSIQVMSLEHYEQLRANGTQFFQAVDREGVTV